MSEARILDRFQHRVATRCPADLPLAMETVARLTPDRWTLEWRLPRWLCSAFDIEPLVADDLTLANVLGLVSIRLQDDLIDGAIRDESGFRDAARLSAELVEEALGVYRGHFPPSSPFWPYLQVALDAWRAASIATTQASGGRGTAPAAAANLAGRGAPLKIGAYGACLLAGRPGAWPRLDRCLDHALSAMVLYDDFLDWEEDLAAGRWNAFVAAAEAHEGRAPTGVPRRAGVQVAMLTGGVIAAHFRAIRAHTLRAARLAEALPSPPLAAFLRDYGERTQAQAATVGAHYRDLGDQATALIFGADSHAGRIAAAGAPAG